MCTLFEPPRDAHIVFLGDSTIRYLYIALAFAWRHGHELRQIDYIEEPGGFDWRAFYDNSSALLADWCDCYRTHCCKAHHPVMENRFLRNLSHGAKVTYLQLFGREVPMRGSWWPGLPDSDRTVHSSWAPKWSMPFTKTIHTLLQLLRPTVVVINLGHHLHTPLHAQELQSMGDSFARLNATIVWATTMQCMKSDQRCNPMVPKLDEGPTAYFKSRFGLMFPAAELTRNLSRECFRDGMHVDFRMNNCLSARLVHLLWPNATGNAAWPWPSCEVVLANCGLPDGSARPQALSDGYHLN